jgi:hypothetical protein
MVSSAASDSGASGSAAKPETTGHVWGVVARYGYWRASRSLDRSPLQALLMCRL